MVLDGRLGWRVSDASRDVQGFAQKRAQMTECRCCRHDQTRMTRERQQIVKGCGGMTQAAGCIRDTGVASSSFEVRYRLKDHPMIGVICVKCDRITRF
jgi:O-glycosyl hydrolase